MFFTKGKLFSENLFFFANAMIGVEVGTDLDQVSVKGFRNICNLWRAGDSNYFLKNMSHFDIIKKAFSNVIENIKYNSPVVSIDYSDKVNNKILLKDVNNKEYTCDYCIITVPVSQLKKLNFTPKLNEKYYDVFNKLKLDNCGKIILKFKKCLWPKDSSWLLIPGLVNVYWSCTQGKNTEMNIITGMTSGVSCRVLNKLYKEDKEAFIDRILNEFKEGLGLKENLKDLLEDYIFFDWADMKYIEGGYTYPIVNEGDIRETLRESVEGKIFFAGEATAEWGHIGTIHGAIESGFRVADKFN